MYKFDYLSAENTTQGATARRLGIIGRMTDTNARVFAENPGQELDIKPLRGFEYLEATLWAPVFLTGELNPDQVVAAASDFAERTFHGTHFDMVWDGDSSLVIIDGNPVYRVVSS